MAARAQRMHEVHLSSRGSFVRSRRRDSAWRESSRWRMLPRRPSLRGLLTCSRLTTVACRERPTRHAGWGRAQDSLSLSLLPRGGAARVHAPDEPSVHASTPQKHEMEITHTHTRHRKRNTWNIVSTLVTASTRSRRSTYSGLGLAADVISPF